MKDFDNYVTGVKEDQVYWIIASAEGAFMDGTWDTQMLSESIHWAMMMGLDIKIVDTRGKRNCSCASRNEKSLSPGMMHRMADLFHLDMTADRKYEAFSLIMKPELIRQSAHYWPVLFQKRETR